MSLFIQPYSDISITLTTFSNLYTLILNNKPIFSYFLVQIFIAINFFISFIFIFLIAHLFAVLQFSQANLKHFIV